MSENKIILLIILALVLVVALFFAVMYFMTPSDFVFEAKISSEIHNDYGFAYPLTYEFSIPDSVLGLKAYKKYAENQGWQQIEEKKNTDFFNGIEAVRFDYQNKKAYISVGFNSISDKIQFKITDSTNKNLKIKYLGISEYYDNRKAVVTITADDWGIFGPNDKSGTLNRLRFNELFDLLREDDIWFTPAVTSQHYNGAFSYVPDSDWQDLQKRINAGYVGVVCHSRTHQEVPYSKESTYEYEILGNKEDILKYLDLPYKNGDREYIFGWVRPYGQGDRMVREILGKSHFLADRVSCCYIQDDFSGWDSINKLYNPIGYSYYLDKGNLNGANEKFDEDYSRGKIYSIYLHPLNNNFGRDSWQSKHFDYIKGRKDVWYTGTDYLYFYHFAVDKNVVKVNDK